MHSLSDLLHHLQRLPRLDVCRLPDIAGTSSADFRKSRPGFCRRSIRRLPDHYRQRFWRNQFCHLRLERHQPWMSISGISDPGTKKFL